MQNKLDLKINIAIFGLLLIIGFMTFGVEQTSDNVIEDPKLFNIMVKASQNQDLTYEEYAYVNQIIDEQSSKNIESELYIQSSQNVGGLATDWDLQSYVRTCLRHNICLEPTNVNVPGSPSGLDFGLDRYNGFKLTWTFD